MAESNVIAFPRRDSTYPRERFLERLKEELTPEEYMEFCACVLDEEYYESAEDYIIEYVMDYYDVCEAEEAGAW